MGVRNGLRSVDAGAAVVGGVAPRDVVARLEGGAVGELHLVESHRHELGADHHRPLQRVPAAALIGALWVIVPRADSSRPSSWATITPPADPVIVSARHCWSVRSCSSPARPAARSCRPRASRGRPCGPTRPRSIRRSAACRSAAGSSDRCTSNRLQLRAEDRPLVGRILADAEQQSVADRMQVGRVAGDLQLAVEYRVRRVRRGRSRTADRSDGTSRRRPVSPRNRTARICSVVPSPSTMPIVVQRPRRSGAGRRRRTRSGRRSSSRRWWSRPADRRCTRSSRTGSAAGRAPRPTPRRRPPSFAERELVDQRRRGPVVDDRVVSSRRSPPRRPASAGLPVPLHRSLR